MAGRYQVNHRWRSHPQWTPGSRLTVRATIRANGAVDHGQARHVLNDWLATLRPAWLTIDGKPELVAYDGGAFVGLSAPSDAAAVCPDVLISAAGDEAGLWIGRLADELYEVVTETLPHLEFDWEELEPRPFGRQ
ncbi:MAG TPA: hypothetical protein VFC82_05700 [Actinomycetaceae bacterium]|nr:hypothetical protein [Actinomycetaceae bacterium]